MASDSWFRFYNTALDDPKVLLLSDSQFRAWLTLLCVASKMDGLIPDSVELIARSLRKSNQKASDTLQVLISSGLIDRIDGFYQPHNWDQRQFKSTTSSERVRKYRERVRQAGGIVGAYLEHREEVFLRDGNICIYCGSDEKLVMDHVVPVIKGGPGEPWNLVTACKSCNSGKAGRDPFEAGLKFIADSHREFCHAAVTACNRDSNAPETEAETKTERKKKVAPLGRFDDFWLVCPKKTARGAAEKAWVKAITLADPDALIAAMRAYAGTCTGKDKAYIKTPGPWLNEKRWLDEGIAPAISDVSQAEIDAAKDKADRYYKRGIYAPNYSTEAA